MAVSSGWWRTINFGEGEQLEAERKGATCRYSNLGVFFFAKRTYVLHLGAGGEPAAPRTPLLTVKRGGAPLDTLPPFFKVGFIYKNIRCRK